MGRSASVSTFVCSSRPERRCSAVVGLETRRPLRILAVVDLSPWRVSVRVCVFGIVIIFVIVVSRSLFYLNVLTSEKKLRMFLYR